MTKHYTRRHREERSDEAIQRDTGSLSLTLDCFACARNWMRWAAAIFPVIPGHRASDEPGISILACVVLFPHLEIPGSRFARPGMTAANDWFDCCLKFESENMRVDLMRRCRYGNPKFPSCRRISGYS
jgi:hypothetical protein